MAILSTVKKVIPYIKEAAGYVLCHISSQAVEMDDGTLLQDKIESMDSEIDGKANTSHTHDNSDIIGLTPDKAVISSGSGKLTTFNNVTSTEVGYLEGVTSNIQDQIDTLNSNLTDVEESVDGLNGKTFKQIYEYSFWNVSLIVYGCDYLRYFCVKGTPENTFNTNTTLSTRPECEPVTGYTEFAEANGRTVSFGAGGEIIATGAGWKQGEYFNVAGFFVATQKIG